MSSNVSARASRHTLAAIASLAFGVFGTANAQDDVHLYERGDIISPKVFVSDSSGSEVSLRSLLQASDSRINVVYIFGGGDLGNDSPGHLWCPDSFEDMHILRTLAAKFTDGSVNFIPVAVAPVYHSQQLGAPPGVFFNEPDDSRAFGKARKAFVESTLAAYEEGYIPVEPYFDLRDRLNLVRDPRFQPGPVYGPLEDWMGAFRKIVSTGFYGVPSLWLVSNDGEVLADVFRGNVYHGDSADIGIQYTFADVDAAVQRLLNR